MVPRPVALITGPTSGLGEGYARRFARDGYDLVLVARDTDRLVALASALRAEHGIDVEVLPADLSSAADSMKVVERLTAGVAVLVNNAGFGTSGEFWTSDLIEERLAFGFSDDRLMTFEHHDDPEFTCDP